MSLAWNFLLKVPPERQAAKRFYTLKTKELHRIYTLFFFIIFGCVKKSHYPTDIVPTYSNFQNAREERNLFGKVKQIQWYKTMYQNDLKKVLTLQEEFTQVGNLKENSNYDSSGVLIQKDLYEYDTEDVLRKIISSNQRSQINYVMTVFNDAKNKSTHRKLVINDSLKQEILSFYNDEDWVVRKIVIEKNDTTSVEYDYKFDKENNLIFEEQIDSETKKPIVINEYTYDSVGNLIRLSYKTEWTQMISETEWKNHRISKETQFTITKDLKKHLDEITEFDLLYNPVNTKIYENSKLNRELKYEYDFDEKGNWTKREVSIKEHFADSNKFIPIFLETRSITYWK